MDRFIAKEFREMFLFISLIVLNLIFMFVSIIFPSSRTYEFNHELKFYLFLLLGVCWLVLYYFMGKKVNKIRIYRSIISGFVFIFFLYNIWYIEKPILPVMILLLLIVFIFLMTKPSVDLIFEKELSEFYPASNILFELVIITTTLLCVIFLENFIYYIFLKLKSIYKKYKKN